MEIYLVRHGIAVGREEDMPDPLRPLTEKGRRRFRKTARAFARLGRKIGLILTSPLVRAVQTAEILAGEAKHGEVAVLEELDPKFGVRSLLEAVSKRANGAKRVALVGHDPQLSSVLAALAGVPAETLDLKKGEIVRLDATELSPAGSAEARWSLKPRSKTVEKGLPLAKADGKEADGAAPRRKARRGPSDRSGPRRRLRARDTTAAASGSESSETAGAAASPEDAETASDSGATQNEPGTDSSPRSPDAASQAGSESPVQPA